MSNDRELLELASKAAGIELRTVKFRPDEFETKHSSGVWIRWMPLDDDGDALRLAVKLGLDVCIDTQQENEPHTHVIGFRFDYTSETVDAIEYHGDPYAATRRAITRAAAEIGRGIE